MDRRLLFSLWFFLSVLLYGCAGFVRSDVAVFHNFSDRSSTVVRYAFVPVKGQESSLEYKNYANLIRSELARYNFEEASVQDAETIVAFFYGIDAVRIKLESVPIFGQTGVSRSQTFGTINTYGNYGTYSGTTTHTPSYGIVGSEVESRTEYGREFSLYIVDKDSIDKGKMEVVYQGNVRSDGSSSQLAKVMPAMIKSLFKDFPGKSGSTRRETFPIN
jgi:hypothetical protein